MINLKTTFVILLQILGFATFAQKLPKLQQVSLRAPATIKINGRADEFENLYQAYNPSTEVFYSMANNDEDLYLVIHADSYNVMNNIMVGGVTLTIKNSAGDKSFTYPAYDAKSTSHLDFNLRGFTTATSVEEANAIVSSNNKIQKDKHKLIKVKGIKAIDTLVAVYNDSGIRAAGLFDNKNAYTLEIAINLKLLGLSVNDKNAFNYQIRVNGEKFYPFIAAPDPVTKQISPEFAEMTAKANERLAQRSAATYFDGKYTLAK